MKLILLQSDICWQTPTANCLRAEVLLAAAPQVDLIVLPEVFATGFSIEAGEAERAAQAGAEVLEWMRRMAARHDAAVAGSVVVEEQGNYYNRFYFVRPDGSFAAYDKRHLFTFAGEDRQFSPGQERVVVEWRGWRMLLQVCYDLRFPVFARNRDDYDLILYVANWPTKRIGVWDTLLAARAIENACYVAGVNRTGSDPFVTYNGHSAWVDFKGNPLAQAEGEREEMLFCEADKEALEAFRKRFPVLDDGDDFTLNLVKDI
ncbi:MAG: amidohydrolase [Rikenellaceae bacterium]|jgi:predicted amidohydrolase|nr:amidohydrolase [Rikenellaceae bacterium]